MENKCQVSGPGNTGSCPVENSRSGFTLVETLLATVISVMVFAALGSLLVKTLQLWGDGASQFYLANQARAARARLLSGGLGPGTGLLSIDTIKSIKTNPNWCTLEYETAGLDNKFWIQGSVDNTAPADKSVFIKENKGGGQTWLAMVGVKRGQQNLPDIRAESFAAAETGLVLNVQYILSYEAGGKVHEYPQLIQAYLVNLQGDE